MNHKKIFSLITVFLLSMTALWAQKKKDVEKPLVTIACLSDVHSMNNMITPASGSIDDITVRSSFIQTLQKMKADEDIDVVVLGGDFQSDKTVPEENATQVRKIINDLTCNVFADGKPKNVLWVTGNHDYEVANYDNIPKPYDASDYYQFPMRDNVGVLSSRDRFYEEADNGALGKVSLLAAYHYRVSGLDFVVLNCGKYYFQSAWNYTYSDESVQWVKDKLDEIYADDPNRTVFFLVHVPFSDSNSLKANKGMTSAAAHTALKAALSQHPNLIMLYGHDHGGDLAYTRELSSQRVTRYDINGNVISTTDATHIDGTVAPNENTNNDETEEYPAVATQMQICSAHDGTYLGWGSNNMSTVTTPVTCTINRAKGQKTYTIKLDGTMPANRTGSYVYSSSGGRFSGNEASLKLYIYKVEELDASNYTLTRDVVPENGGQYAIVVQNSKNTATYYALTNEHYSDGSESQRLVGMQFTDLTDGDPSLTVTISKESFARAVWVFQGGEESGEGQGSSTSESFTGSYYVRSTQNSTYLGWGDYNLSTVSNPVSCTIARNSNQNYYSLKLNGQVPAAEVGEYVFSSTGGRFSGNSATAKTYVYKVTAENGSQLTLTRDVDPSVGGTYMFVVQNSKNTATYYALTNEHYSDGSSSQRLVGKQITDLGTDGLPSATLTCDATEFASCLWTLEAIPPTAEGNGSFFSAFMGSMRYYFNSIDTGDPTDMPTIVQALMVYVYPDRVVLSMKNYNQTGTFGSITINDELATYTSYRPVTLYDDSTNDYSTQTGQNTLSAQDIKDKADAGELLVSLQNHTTTSNQYVNRKGNTQNTFSTTGATTWVVEKYGEGYALKDILGNYLKGTSRPAQFTKDIAEATLYMPEDAEADVSGIADGYNSSKAVRWKVLPGKDLWLNTNGASSTTTVQWNNTTDNWSCLFTYEVRIEEPINVTYVLWEDGKEVDRQVTVQMSNSTIEIPLAWDRTCYEYETSDVIGFDDCTVNVTRTLKSKVYESAFVRVASISAGKTYAIFNTAVNGTETRYGYYYAHSSSQLACNPCKPSLFPNNDTYLWEVEDYGTGLFAFKNKSTGTYINAAQRTLGDATGWKVEPWMTSTATKSSVNSMNEDETVVANASISDADKVFTVTNPEGSDRTTYWNGNDTSLGNTAMPALWSNAHPFAFYAVENLAYLFNTYILQEEDGTFVTKTVVKQPEGEAAKVPAAWLLDTKYSYEIISGETGSENATIIVKRVEKEVCTPTNGSVFRILSTHGTYLTGNISGTGTSARYLYQTDADASTLWFMVNDMIYNYATGNAFQGRGDATTITEFGIEEAAGEEGKYVVRFLPGSGARRYLWAWSPSDTKANQADQNSTEDVNTRFTLEAVHEIPLEVGDTRYATLYLPVAVQSTEGVVFNTVTGKKDNYLLLEEVNNIAANTPVIVKADVAGTYMLPVIKNGEEVSGNLLSGVAVGGETIAAEVKAYILGSDDTGAGFFPLSATERTLGSWSAYYVSNDDSEESSYYLSEITGLNSLEKNKANEVLFDLQGRRVQNIQKGLYIKNSKKVLVK